MSLINEALKKARVEAARREAAERGMPYPVLPEAKASRPWIWALAGAAALAVALAVFSLGSRLGGGVDSPSPTAAVAPAPTPVPVTIADAPTPSVSEASPAPRGAQGAPRAEPTVPPRSAPSRPEPSPAPQPPTAQPAPQPAPELAPVAARPAQAPAAPATAAVPELAAGEHLRQAPLPGGGTLSLDGIAWSEVQPAAVLNGEIVGVGERISGVRVDAIERDRVTVSDGEAVLVIRLK
ncbi:MAG: hypothetical protein AAF481_13260 [Acidobacteriota bacterium]